MADTLAMTGNQFREIDDTLDKPGEVVLAPLVVGSFMPSKFHKSAWLLLLFPDQMLRLTCRSAFAFQVGKLSCLLLQGWSWQKMKITLGVQGSEQISPSG